MTTDFSGSALSPLDGRYAKQTSSLCAFFSEAALFKYRLKIEVEWLLWICRNQNDFALPAISSQQQTWLKNLYLRFDSESYSRIKAIEKICNHDVKAVEYFLKEKLAEQAELVIYKEWIHFGCTSEDINNLAYGLMLKDALQQIIFPCFDNLISNLTSLAHQYSEIAMLARTHGQPATPTTVGKEFANVCYRLKRQVESLHALPILGKFNGAVGNYNAHLITISHINWPTFNQHFVEELGLTWNPYTTQIEPHDYIAAILSQLALIHNVLIDLSRDCWSYISLDYFKQKVNAQEVGSSTMPHKVNPIDFENAEGNLSFAQAMAQFLATRLPISRWQRDLVDSTLLRNIGSVLGYSLIGYQSLLRGLNKLEVNEGHIRNDLALHYEILAEAIQTIMRHHQLPMPYEQLKALTRGQKVTRDILHQFIQNLELPSDIKQTLLALTPEQYLGYAKELAKKI